MQRAKAEAPLGVPMTIQEYAEMRVESEFGEGQWESFNNIIIHESHWDYTIRNKHSAAAGLCQTMLSIHNVPDNFMEVPEFQIDWCINYIKTNKEYKTPNGAWYKWQWNCKNSKHGCWF